MKTKRMFRLSYANEEKTIEVSDMTEAFRMFFETDDFFQLSQRTEKKVVMLFVRTYPEYLYVEFENHCHFPQGISFEKSCIRFLSGKDYPFFPTTWIRI